MNITIIAFGSRGDIQPKVALGVALQAAGHRARLVAPERFAGFAAENGLDFAPLPGDIDAMSKALVEEGGTNLFKNIKVVWEFSAPLGVEVFRRMEAACADADAIVYSFLLAIPGDWIARKRGIPGFFAHLIPLFVPTRHVPPALMPELPLFTATNNRLLQRAFTSIFWQSNLQTYRIVQRGHDHLPPARELRLPAGRADSPPNLYGFSRHVIPDDDFPPNATTTGWWYLDSRDNYTPPDTLTDFITSGQQPIYLGFGSMVAGDMDAFLHMCVDAIRQAKQRAVILTGWGGMAFKDEFAGSDDIIVMESAPHDWLFPQMRALVHHGGAGTTGAAFRSGVPQVVVPFFGDQFMWGKQVAKLGAGPSPVFAKHATRDRLALAIHTAATYPPMAKRAAELGEKVRAENGVERAVRIIEDGVKKI